MVWVRWPWDNSLTMDWGPMTRTCNSEGTSPTIAIWAGRLANSRAICRLVSVRSSPLTANHKASASSSDRSLRPLLRPKCASQFFSPGSFRFIGSFHQILQDPERFRRIEILPKFASMGQGDLAGGFRDHQDHGIGLLGEPHRGAMAGAQGGPEMGVFG